MQELRDKCDLAPSEFQYLMLAGQRQIKLMTHRIAIENAAGARQIATVDPLQH